MDFEQPNKETDPIQTPDSHLNSDAEKSDRDDSWKISPAEVKKIAPELDNHTLISQDSIYWDAGVIQKMFPDKNFELIKKDDEVTINLKGFFIRVKNFNSLHAIWEILEDSQRGEQFQYGEAIPSTYDLLNVLKDPAKGFKEMQRMHEEQRKLLTLKRIAREYISREQVSSSAAFGYGLREEGSAWLTNTFVELIGHGLDPATSQKILEKFNKLDEDLDPDPEINVALEDFKPLKGKTVLEIGCGRRGRFLEVLEQLGAEVVGLDIQKPYEDNIVKIYQGDIQEIDQLPAELKNRKFDYVVSTMMFVPEIMHYSYAKDAAEQFLNEGGTAVFSPDVGEIFDKEHFFDFKKKRRIFQSSRYSTVVQKVPEKDVDVFSNHF